MQAQQAEHKRLSLSGNYAVIPTQRSYGAGAGKACNEPGYYSYPGFGKLTFNAPEGKSVAEDLSRRTPYKRYDVDLDQPLFFYIGKSTRPIN